MPAYKSDNDLYSESLKAFSDKIYISTARIQRIMQVSYPSARYVLDRFISEGFASKQIGSRPCIVLTGRFKKLKYILGITNLDTTIFISHISYFLKHQVPFKARGIYVSKRYDYKKFIGQHKK